MPKADIRIAALGRISMAEPPENPLQDLLKKPWQAVSGAAVITFFLGSSGVVLDYLTYSQ